MRVVHQNHFGSQCVTERVYRYLPAKVELKKSHLGKQSLTECALRYPPCQSEFAEAPRVAYLGGTSPLTATIVATPGGLFAFPYFAFAKYTARPAH